MTVGWMGGGDGGNQDLREIRCISLTEISFSEFVEVFLCLFEDCQLLLHLRQLLTAFLQLTFKLSDFVLIDFLTFSTLRSTSSLIL